MALLLYRITEVPDRRLKGKQQINSMVEHGKTCEINLIQHLQPCLLHWRTHEESCSSYVNTKFLGILQLKALGLSLFPLYLQLEGQIPQSSDYDNLWAGCFTWVSSEKRSRCHENHPKRQRQKSERSKATQAALLQRNESSCLEATQHGQTWKGVIKLRKDLTWHWPSAIPWVPLLENKVGFLSSKEGSLKDRSGEGIIPFNIASCNNSSLIVPLEASKLGPSKLSALVVLKESLRCRKSKWLKMQGARAPVSSVLQNMALNLQRMASMRCTTH